MTPHFRRRDPSPTERWIAAMAATVAGVTVGVSAYYLVRVLLARESIESLPPRRLGGASRGKLPPPKERKGQPS